MADDNKNGRPPTYTAEEKQKIVTKVEPYLKGGLPVSKAIIEAGVPRGTFYRLMSEDEGFRDKINQFRNFTAILANNAIIGELQAIIKKQQGYKDDKGKMVKAVALKKIDHEFLWKFALNANMMREMYGERKELNLFDPEAEIQKVKGILEESTTREIQDVPDDQDETK